MAPQDVSQQEKINDHIERLKKNIQDLSSHLLVSCYQLSALTSAAGGEEAIGKEINFDIFEVTVNGKLPDGQDSTYGITLSHKAGNPLKFKLVNNKTH